MNAAVPRLTQEVRETMVRKFIMTKIAEVLDDNLPQFDPVALRDNSFVAILPEATAVEADAIAKTIVEAVEEQLGISLCTGIATLPSDAQTFEELVAAAESRAKHPPKRGGSEPGERGQPTASRRRGLPAPERETEGHAPIPEAELTQDVKSALPSGD
jgi:hypothetical protein